ncbi:hypothetical protein GOP47_0014366 [Adiantum capillus-veneris]|uniref:Uncharacterized protein n=1 Tax=Adiantum capillus-veneris TaxID=13818 RepID=A0A9D4UMG3_ADICA|nr:hypothetical protein GOP47_0030774 [Adiantum capillus-veneris]KAI5070023.1 hypothetical protein GOP47_0014366 [Adiantum capillus-veneris]
MAKPSVAVFEMVRSKGFRLHEHPFSRFFGSLDSITMDLAHHLISTTAAILTRHQLVKACKACKQHDIYNTQLDEKELASCQWKATIRTTCKAANKFQNFDYARKENR